MLKNSHFLCGRKTPDFLIKLPFFIISTASHISKYVQKMQRGKLNRISVFRNMSGGGNNQKKLILWENLVFFFHIENVSFLTFLMYKILKVF